METAAVQTKKGLWSGGRSPFNVSYGKLMMWYFLLSDSFTFGAFLISYGTIRFSSNYWVDHNYVFNSFPGIHANAPLAFVSLMTFILIFSSVTMVLAVHEGHKMNKKGVEKWLMFTILGGLAFLSCQAVEWTHLLTTSHPVLVNGQIEYWNTTTSHNPWGPRVLFEGGLINTPGPVAFGGYFFGITGFHGFHVSVGVILLIITLINTKRGVFHNRGHYEMVEKIGLYWHFVDLVWVFVFLCFYLI
ncbi:MAG TPA: cytochrome c oxidase subunit 3 [Ginsengibacter sp.]|nr:cytochrome c oxidase subunit 3 [Chitinophagaceae bacterium]MCZ2396427.1 cytochrome c oxidase subunit 3 [Chitinophagales bacterium]HRN71765.1 cytochrome c oxidase subunit 3 [Ginsengibacter sp.]MCW5915236.1 cytochrome c oxidase subunit 3 [Chitinophagaceae bacterium]HRP16461.1 cytochrome c oxidase subunit 3 [Ginsengibacter sp.]